MKHELKILPKYYEAILDGSKTFEIRHNDREFQRGDKVTLREIKDLEDKSYTGRFTECEIGHVSHFEQKMGWCVFSILNLEHIK